MHVCWFYYHEMIVDINYADQVGNFVEEVDTLVDKGDESFEQMDPSQAYAAIAAADARLEQLRSEPEKIRLWREEQTKYLNEKGINYY